MDFAWNVTKTANFIIEIVLIVAVLAVLTFALVKVCKRKNVYPFIITFDVLAIVSYLLTLTSVFYLICIIGCVTTFIVLQANMGDLRKFLSNPFQVKSGKNENFGVQKIFDEDYLIDQIYDAVSFLSKGLMNEQSKEVTHVGAIITFEQSQSMRDIIKNGVQLNIPVSSAILKTIFYPGTMLHDGAVVIHGNTILAASVFYNPSTRAYAKKFGSRHRAAVGISEITDAITVIVSEETGRVSIAVNGELITVELSQFKERFKSLYKKI